MLCDCECYQWIVNGKYITRCFAITISLYNHLIVSIVVVVQFSWTSSYEKQHENQRLVYLLFLYVHGKKCDWLTANRNTFSFLVFVYQHFRDVSDDDDHNMNLKIKKSCQWKLSDLAIQQSVKFNLAKIETVFLQLRLNLVLSFNWRVQKVYFNSGNTLCMPLIECQVE